MWSTLAAVLGVAGLGAALVVGETEEDPLDPSPRGITLALFSAAAVLIAVALTVIGLASWRWTAAATAFAVARFFWRWFLEADVGDAMLDGLVRRHGPRGR